MLEVVIAMTLMGIAFAAMFGALSTASIATLRNNQQVQVEVALAQGKATLQSAAFDATGNYSAQFPILQPTGCTISSADCLSVSLNPKPAVADPGIADLTKLQAVTLQAKLGAVVRSATVYKSNR